MQFLFFSVVVLLYTVCLCSIQTHEQTNSLIDASANEFADKYAEFRSTNEAFESFPLFMFNDELHVLSIRTGNEWLDESRFVL